MTYSAAFELITPEKAKAYLVLAMMDFNEGKTRQMNYQLREPMKCLEIMDAIRKEDGLA